MGHGEDFRHPFVWVPGEGLHLLPTLGGVNGQPVDVNEFGEIAGGSVTAAGEVRAALWIPAAGPLALAPAEAHAATNDGRIP